MRLGPEYSFVDDTPPKDDDNGDGEKMPSTVAKPHHPFFFAVGGRKGGKTKNNDQRNCKSLSGLLMAMMFSIFCNETCCVVRSCGGPA